MNQTANCESLLELVPFDDFETASRAVLSLLRDRFGLRLWMMTRVEERDWIVLQVEDRGYNVAEGTVLQWADSFCSRMVRGRGPRVAIDADRVAAYASAPIAQQLPIGAYVGVPIHTASGQLFGTLCAIDPDPQDAALEAELPLIELLARLLGTILSADLNSLESDRQLERARRDSTIDGLTHLYNRRAWEQALELEEGRARRYGIPCCVAIVDLDGLKQANDIRGHAYGDALIVTASRCLESAVRSNDFVARLGGDEFGILAADCGEIDASQLIDRVREGLAAAGIEASIGVALRDPMQGLVAAVRAADLAMYADKKRRKAGA